MGVVPRLESFTFLVVWCGSVMVVVSNVKDVISTTIELNLNVALRLYDSLS